MAPCRRGAVRLLLAVLLQLAAVVVLCIHHEAAVVARADTINSQYCRACKICEQHVIGKKQQQQQGQADGRFMFSPAPANQKVSATDLGIAENVCRRRDEADPYWIDSLHIARKGDRFELVVEGRCNAECETVKSAWQELMKISGGDSFKKKISGGVDQLKLTKSIDELMNFLCESAACTKEQPPSPKVSATHLGIAENVCRRRDEPDPYWIDSLHIARKDDRFELVVEGRCNAECETVKSACQELLMKISGGDSFKKKISGGVDQLKLTKSIDELMNFLCESAPCTKEQPPSPKGIFNVWGQKSIQVFKHCGKLAIEVTSIVPEIVRAPWNWGKKIWAKDEE